MKDYFAQSNSTDIGSQIAHFNGEPVLQTGSTANKGATTSKGRKMEAWREKFSHMFKSCTDSMVPAGGFVGNLVATLVEYLDEDFYKCHEGE